MKKTEDRKMIQHEIHDEMKNSYIDYAMSVIVGRALPDVRDGLKPVHRRILYGMSELGITPDKPHRKSARIVGDVMGKFHPHGDSSIYDAMVKMAQPFATRYPLVDGHGNFGSIDGDGAAAMRYTEARMTPFALQMLRDINKDTVDFIPNFDEEEMEPSVLPSRIPNLLVNGSNGIAVGMATSIPPHNIGETINAVIKLIDKPKCSVEELIRAIKGPDFPTGAQILGKKELEEAYKTGQGKIQVRSVTQIEPASRGRTQIVVTEIPYQVNKSRMLEKIGDLARDRKIDGISAIRDESSRQGMRIVIELKRDTDPQVVLNKLYKMTQLQDTFSIILLALVDGQPRILNLKEIIEEYLKHQKEVVTRRTRYDLEKAAARAHVLEGLRIALKNIDAVIKTIRSSHDDAKQRLMKKFKLTDIQAQAILDMRLAKLQGLERKKIEEEYKEVCNMIKHYKKLLKSEKLLMGVIKDELLEIRKKYNDKRRTKISSDTGEVVKEDMIEEKTSIITMTHKGYLKRIPVTSGTKNKIEKELSRDVVRGKDFTSDIIVCSSHDDLMLFTSHGKAFKIKAYDIPEAAKRARGTAAVNLMGISKKERIVAALQANDTKSGKYVSVATKGGVVKRVQISDIDTDRQAGTTFISLKEKDEVVSVNRTNGKGTLAIFTKMGKCIKFSEGEVRSMGKTAGGVRGITLESGDEVISMLVVKTTDTVAVVTEKGFGKRVPTNEFKAQARGGKGVLAYDKHKFKKTGVVVGVVHANDEQNVLLTERDGTVKRFAADTIPVLSRAANGSVLEKGAEIVSVGSVTFGEEKRPEM